MKESRKCFIDSFLEVKQLRAQCGLTQESIAAELGVTPHAVYLWESGQRIPTEENASAYLKALHVAGAQRGIDPIVSLYLTAASQCESDMDPRLAFTVTNALSYDSSAREFKDLFEVFIDPSLIDQLGISSYDWHSFLFGKSVPSPAQASILGTALIHVAEAKGFPDMMKYLSKRFNPAA